MSVDPVTTVGMSGLVVCVLLFAALAWDFWLAVKRARRANRVSEARHARAREDFYWRVHRQAEYERALELRAARLGAHAAKAVAR